MSNHNFQITNLDHLEDQAFRGWLRKIGDQLEQTERGITLQVLDRGVSSLSEKQRRVFEESVIAAHAIERCSMCSHRIPWAEMQHAQDTGLCASCANAVSAD